MNKISRTIVVTLHVITIGSTLIGAAIAVFGMLAANGAPQEAAAAAIGCFFAPKVFGESSEAVAPYCVARAVENIFVQCK